MTKDDKKTTEIFNLNKKGDNINRYICDNYPNNLTLEDVKKKLGKMAPADNTIRIWLSDLTKTMQYLESQGKLTV